MSGIEGLVVEGSPEVVVLRGERNRPDAWCWRLTTREGDGLLAKRRVYYVDTAMPRIVHVRNFFDSFVDPPTTGAVEGSGMPAADPWYPYRGNSNDLVTHRIPGIRVNGTPTGQSTTSAYADGNGEFSISAGAANQAITLAASFGPYSPPSSRNGQWYHLWIVNASPSDYLADSQGANVGDDRLLTLSSSNSQFDSEMRTAQVDSIICARRCRDFLLQYVWPGYSLFLYLLPNEPGVGGQGGTWAPNGGGSFTLAFRPSYNPTPPLVGSWNAASHSTIAHEFGHALLHIVAPELFGVSGFHEGFADSFSTLLLDISVQGPSQRMDGGNIRDDPTVVNCQYPLTTSECGCAAAHSTGQLLSGIWVRIRTGLKSYYGNSTGLNHARTIFGQWAMVTSGGDETCEGAYPGTLIELLSLFPSETSEDAPKIEVILASFAAHNICQSGPCNE